jgi:lipopolysaccharide export system permease protein
MKLNSILSRYIIKEMLAPFGINVFVFSFLFLMTRMVDITNWIVNYNLSLGAVLMLIWLTMPWFLMFILPMSVMLAVLLTFLRLSSDNEIVALKSCGLSIYGLLPPVLLFCFVGFLLTIFITLYGVPKAKTALEELALKVATSNIDIGLKERTFNDAFKGVMMYVNRIDLKNKKLIDIFIEDKRQPNIVSTVVAPEGQLLSEPEKLIFHLILSNGTIHQTNLKEHSANSIRFATYKLSLDLKKEIMDMSPRHKSREEMSIAELRNLMNDAAIKKEHYYDAQIILHRRFSIPVACICLGLLAFPLGIQSKSRKRSYGLILCLFFFLLYYLMLTAGYAFGENGVYPPVIGMWLPNFATACLGLYFILQTGRERRLKIDIFYQRVQQFLSRFNRFKYTR